MEGIGVANKTSAINNKTILDTAIKVKLFTSLPQGHAIPDFHLTLASINWLRIDSFNAITSLNCPWEEGKFL